MKTVKEYNEQLEEIRRDKFPFMPLWQLIGKYINQRKMNFTSCVSPGEFYLDEVFDDSTVKAARKLALALVGMLWQGGESVRLAPPEGLKITGEIKDYFRVANERLQGHLDDPRNGLVGALQEYMHDEVTFGTSGIGCFEGEKTGALLEFLSYGVDECTIDEDDKGNIDTMFTEKEWTVRKLIKKYGKENVSQEVRELYSKGKTNDKIKFYIVIAPREGTDPKKKGNLNMPFERIDYEAKSEKILKRSGYEEQCVYWSRFYKLRNEKYGRSPGSDSMATTLELQFFRELRTDIMEKAADPPVVVLDDGVGGAGVIDTSAGGVIVANTNGRGTSPQNPIYPLFEGQNPPITKEMIEELRENINEHFSIDRLLDFSTNAEMTLGEAQIRENIRSQSMFSLFFNEIRTLTGLCERAVSILFRNNELGIMPNRPEAIDAIQNGIDLLIIPETLATMIVQGKEFYKLDFMTPAARLLEAEQAKGIMQVLEVAAQDPVMGGMLDRKFILEKLARSWGAPPAMIFSEKILDQMAKAANEKAQAQEELAMAQQGAVAAKDGSQAVKNLGEAQIEQEAV